MVLGLGAAGGWSLLGVALALIALALSLSALVGQRRIERHLLGVMSEPDMRGALVRVAEGLAPVDRRLAALERAQSDATQRETLLLGAPGVVRFHAFGGQGPAMSFSIALVNARRDGIVLTSLYGRDQVRLYAKPVVAGVASLELGAEEREALALAESVRGDGGLSSGEIRREER